MAHEYVPFNKYATEYDPIKIGSIDGTDTEPHDRAIIRALNSEYIPNKQVKGNPCHTIFIARLNPKTPEDVVQTVYSRYGKIVRCHLVRDIVTGKSKQYAFVEYECESSVDNAIRDNRKVFIDECEVVVEREAARRLRGWRPRRLGGGFGGRKESGQLRFGCRDRPFRAPILVDRHDHSDAPILHLNYKNRGTMNIDLQNN